MDLGLTEDQELLKAAAADFIRQEYDKDTLIALEETSIGVTPELFRQAADLGWLGILIPESFGGTGRSFTDAAVLFEELGRGPVLGPPPNLCRLRRHLPADDGSWRLGPPKLTSR